MTRRADVEDESGPSTLERQDRALDGPPTLVQQEATGDAGEPPTIVRIAGSEEEGATEPATRGGVPLTLWSTAPRWAKSLFLFGVTCFAAAFVLWVVRSSRGEEPREPMTDAKPGDAIQASPEPHGDDLPKRSDVGDRIPGGATSSAPEAGDSARSPIEANVGGDPLVDAAIDARAALEALREGIRTCVESTIGVLPGTSPPLPRELSHAAGGGYQGSSKDYASPFFMCTRLRVNGPMRFQIQWQLDKPSSEGTGVAWIDDDSDGRPDRAFGFQGKLLERSKVELGEIGPIPATRPVRPR